MASARGHVMQGDVGPDRYCFGVEDTMKGLDLGAVETLICWENLAVGGSFYRCLPLGPRVGR